MPKYTLNPDRSRALTKTHKLGLAGVATLGAAALAFSVVPAGGETTTTEAAAAAAPVAYGSGKVTEVKATLTDQLAAASLKVEAIEAQHKAAQEAAAKAKAAADAKKKAEAEAKKKAAEKAAKERAAKEAASRSAKRAQVKKAAVKSYPNNLDGWIREALDIMKKHNIPGTYNGLYRNIIRESSGNPNAINNWDINAQNGVPSIGLLQVIKPTFDAYHVPGTAWSQYDPVANLTAAANYAADRYGSIDNVNSAY
ncbi:transglycosylase SLT domain-containing protein [Streptomyces sp. enrichment culture]|uniref:transglycosylase SLT domain-containing protein n=1 Tax=Streptomyces sp. enrichment culture TaxID=1795815 RepID=UPI003F57C2C0